MSDVILRAEGLAKKYLIGHERPRERYTALRDVMSRAARDLVQSARDMVRGRQLVVGDEVEEYWALKDINFEIRRGDVVGIIGRNGAGKSTLLKILSRITEPSEGRVTIKGRVASLLEVGTGFHPELTGRENIFLNGAILGMTRAEIRRKFDEIVAFADIEKFLDTPVKRYSSGMYVRLAFAVAAHLEPEILIVDEVLAVGDAEFQKKCLGKMRDVAGDGRTVLFVSHNMSAVQTLCSRCILLAKGTIAAIGSTNETIGKYVEDVRGTNEYNLPRDLNSIVDVYSAKVDVEIEDSGRVSISVRARIFVRCDIRISFDVRIKGSNGTPAAFATASQLDPSACISLTAGDNDIEMQIDVTTLCDGRYLLSLAVSQPKVAYLQVVEDCLTFELVRSPGGLGVRVPQQSWGLGPICLPSRATVEQRLALQFAE